MNSNIIEIIRIVKRIRQLRKNLKELDKLLITSRDKIVLPMIKEIEELEVELDKRLEEIKEN